MHRRGRPRREGSGHMCTCTHTCALGMQDKAVCSGAGGKSNLCGMWGSFTKEAESELGLGWCRINTYLWHGYWFNIAAGRKLGHVRHQPCRPCSGNSSLCFLPQRKEKVRISIYKFKYRKRQAVRKLISQWLNPIHAENPGKGCVCQLTNVGNDPMWREATIRMPFHALITTGQRQQKENFLLYKTEVKLKEGPTNSTSVGLRMRAIINGFNGIHSIFKSFRNWQKPTKRVLFAK